MYFTNYFYFHDGIIETYKGITFYVKIAGVVVQYIYKI